MLSCVAINVFIKERALQITIDSQLALNLPCLGFLAVNLFADAMQFRNSQALQGALKHFTKFLAHCFIASQWPL